MKQGQRAHWHDYKGVGFYMVTLTTAGRHPLFGQVVKPGVMELSSLGHQVLKAWRAMPTPKYFTAKAARNTQRVSLPHLWIHRRQSDPLRKVY